MTRPLTVPGWAVWAGPPLLAAVVGWGGYLHMQQAEANSSIRVLERADADQERRLQRIEDNTNQIIEVLRIISARQQN